MPTDFISSREPVEGGKYDIVIMLGTDVPGREAMQQALDSSGLSYCIIGNGSKDSYLAKEELAILRGKIDENTNIIINGHGFAKKHEVTGDYLHQIGFYSPDSINPSSKPADQRNIEASVLLSDLKEIFVADPKNNGKQMAVDIFSCHGGAIKYDEPGVKLTLHSGKKYATLQLMGTPEILDAIAVRKTETAFDPYQRFMYSLVTSPETINFSEGGHRFKAAAPSRSLSANENLEKYLRGQIKAFLEFRKNTLGHQITDAEINDQVRNFPISKNNLQQYNDLSLMMEINRGGKKALQHAQESIDRGANVNAVIKEVSPICLACQRGNVEIVKMLLAKGADPNAMNIGIPIISQACDTGNVEIVEILLKNGADVNKIDKNGDTPLHRLCQNSFSKHFEILSKMINGGDPDLYQTWLRNNEKILNELLENGANVNKTNKAGQTPLLTACECGDDRAVSILLKVKDIDVYGGNSSRHTPLYAAILKGHTKVVEVLLKNGVDINKPMPSGHTLLSDACNFNEVEAAKRLIELGADVSKVDKNGETPLMHAARWGNEELVGLILSRITDVHAITKKDSFIPLLGKTAAEMARKPEISAMIQAKITQLTSIAAANSSDPAVDKFFLEHPPKSGSFWFGKDKTNISLEDIVRHALGENNKGFISGHSGRATKTALRDDYKVEFNKKFEESSIDEKVKQVCEKITNAPSKKLAVVAEVQPGAKK